MSACNCACVPLYLYVPVFLNTLGVKLNAVQKGWTGQGLAPALHLSWTSTPSSWGGTTLGY